MCNQVKSCTKHGRPRYSIKDSVVYLINNQLINILRCRSRHYHTLPQAETIFIMPREIKKRNQPFWPFCCHEWKEVTPKCFCFWVLQMVSFCMCYFFVCIKSYHTQTHVISAVITQQLRSAQIVIWIITYINICSLHHSCQNSGGTITHLHELPSKWWLQP